MQIMRVKRWSHKFVPHKFFIAPYIIMNDTQEHVNIKVVSMSQEALFDGFT